MNAAWYLVILLSIALIYILYKQRHKKPKEHADLHKKSGVGGNNPTLMLIETPEERKKVLEFMILCKAEEIKVSLESVVHYFTHFKNLRKLYSVLKKVNNAGHSIDVLDLAKVLEAKGDIDQFTDALIDQLNSGVDISIDSHLSHIRCGGDMKTLIDTAIRASRAGLELDYNDLLSKNLDDEEIKKIVHALIRAKKAGIYLTEDQRASLNLAVYKDFLTSFKITQKQVLDLHVSKRDVNVFVNAMIRAHEAEIDLSLTMLDVFSLTDDAFNALVNNMIKAKNEGVIIDQEDLIHQNLSGNDINKLVSSIIVAKKNQLNIEFADLMEYHIHTAGDVEKFVKALSFIKTHKLSLSKENLIELSLPNADLVDYVTTLKIILSSPEIGISQNDITSHFSKKGKVLHVVENVFYAKSKNLPLSFSLACAIDLADGIDIPMAIRWATVPAILDVNPTLSIVTQEGIQIAPQIRVTLRGRLDQIFGGYREDIVFKRINEATVDEIACFKTHEDVLEHLNDISRKVFLKVKGELPVPKGTDEISKQHIDYSNKREKELNINCAYEILEINIYDIVIGHDIKAHLEKEQAEIEAHIHQIHAHADLVKAEADIRIAMVEAYKNGEIPNFNELHKDNLLKELKQDKKH